MLLLRIAQTSENEFGEETIEVILPLIERKHVQSSRPQAIHPDAGEHASGPFVHTVDAGVSQGRLSPQPAHSRRGTRESIEKDAVGGRYLLKKPVDQNLAVGRFEREGGNGQSKCGLIGSVYGGDGKRH